ncbi:MAG TPA: acetate--CoA ligase family protein, partial [Candidatus Nitrosopolaris sp.]|nr:acetate--CoA ligase family protein [Candidatus Nitrosopolaris sp.]
MAKTRNSIQNIFDNNMSGKNRVITEETAKEILTEYKIKVPPYALVRSESEALEKAREIGFPLVAKVVSAEILHKTDVKGVRVGLRSETDVREEFLDMYGRLSKQFELKGVLLEKMVQPGVELIVGLQNDPQFGPVIMLGMGGIYTEVFKDVSFRVLPITKADALQMIEDLKGKQILKGFRGSEPIDTDMLGQALVNIGNLGTDNAAYYSSIDFNPLIAYPHDYYVVDAKIILKDKPDPEAISRSQPDSSYLDLFFNARSIALIGASPERGKVGNSVFESLVKHEYKGKVFPVNAKGYSEIMGVKAYKNLEEINEPVEVVVVTVDLRFVPDLLKICGNRGIHNMVIISGGGKELGGERAVIEQQIKDLSSQLKVRIIGPNCIG